MLNVENRSIKRGFRNKIYTFNGPYISSIPEIKIFDLKEIKKEKGGILLASDGLWDELSSEKVLEIVRNQNFNKTKIPGLVLEEAIEKISYRSGNPIKSIKNKTINGANYRNIHDDISIIYYAI